MGVRLQFVQLIAQAEPVLLAGGEEVPLIADLHGAAAQRALIEAHEQAAVGPAFA